MQQKGFTLLELIIVIGILAVLATVSVLVLNPAQLFAQDRDTTRISDLGTLRSAIGLYLSSVSSPTQLLFLRLKTFDKEKKCPNLSLQPEMNT